MTHTSGPAPPRTLVDTILVASGDQDGAVSTPEALVRGTKDSVATVTDPISWSGRVPMRRGRAITSPLGDQTGGPMTSFEVVIWFLPVPSGFMSQTSRPLTKASWVPS